MRFALKNQLKDDHVHVAAGGGMGKGVRCVARMLFVIQVS